MAALFGDPRSPGADLAGEGPRDGSSPAQHLQRHYGQPWWGLYFWRNIGTEAKPRFARAIRLRFAGQWITDFYASHQVTDWD